MKTDNEHIRWPVHIVCQPRANFNEREREVGSRDRVDGQVTG